MTQTLVFKLHKVGNSLTRYERHHSYLERCNSNNIISKGFLRTCNVTYTDQNLQDTCQRKQDKASWEIQNEVTNWQSSKVKLIKKDFSSIKARLFQVATDRAKRFLKIVKQEMKELADKLKREKQKKWQNINIKGRKYHQNINVIRNTQIGNREINLPKHKHRSGHKRRGEGETSLKGRKVN